MPIDLKMKPCERDYNEHQQSCPPPFSVPVTLPPLDSVFSYHLHISFLKIYFIDYAITVIPFLPLYFLLPCIPSPTGIPPHPLVQVHLASTFPILFLTSPIYFVTIIYATYSLYLFPHSTPDY